MKPIAAYSELAKKFNAHGSSLRLPLSLPHKSGVILHQEPITISMDFDKKNPLQVDKIIIHCSEDNNPLYDEAFEGFEVELGWNSINFYNAYRKASLTNLPQVGKAHGIKVTHFHTRPNDLTVEITREK